MINNFARLRASIAPELLLETSIRSPLRCGVACMTRGSVGPLQVGSEGACGSGNGNR